MSTSCFKKKVGKHIFKGYTSNHKNNKLLQKHHSSEIAKVITFKICDLINFVSAAPSIKLKLLGCAPILILYSNTYLTCVPLH